MNLFALFLQQNSFDPKMMPGILAAVFGFYLVLFIVIAVIFIVPTWNICKKAGFSPWLSLLVAIPFFGFLGLLILLYVLAFSEWKVASTPPLAAWQPPPPPAPPLA